MQMQKISTLVSVAALAALTACSSEPTRRSSTRSKSNWRVEPSSKRTVTR